MKKLIVFVCNGNIHRSVIAAAFFTNILEELGLDTQYQVESYGLQGTLGTPPPLHKKLKEYPKEWSAAAPILHEFDINIDHHSYQKITPAVAQKAAVIIAMDTKTYSAAPNALLKQFPNAAQKIHSFSELTPGHKDITDPLTSGSQQLHRNIIGAICSTLLKNTDGVLRMCNAHAK
ncbi:MAG: hypothetical protein JNK33_02840 [Candidatus Doudnabacteria bacterium]|nr:hypothetical protein [Candidatus Doudnabacteria bacterium]